MGSSCLVLELIICTEAQNIDMIVVSGDRSRIHAVNAWRLQTRVKIFCFQRPIICNRPFNTSTCSPTKPCAMNRTAGTSANVHTSLQSTSGQTSSNKWQNTIKRITDTATHCTHPVYRSITTFARCQAWGGGSRCSRCLFCAMHIRKRQITFDTINY